MFHIILRVKAVLNGTITVPCKSWRNLLFHRNFLPLYVLIINFFTGVDAVFAGI
jgi:hypothetical protein